MKRIHYFMQKKLLLILIALMLKINHSLCQDFTYANVVVKTVSFSGGNLNIKKDDGSGTYTVPQWSSSNSTQNPVAYVSGSKATVAAAFTIDCPNVPATVMIRGEGSDSINFAQTTLTVASSANTVHNINYPATAASKVFTAGVVRFYNPFSITWKISFDNGVNWKTIGVTKNTLYVTRNTPQAETSNFIWFHTVYDLSCRNADYRNSDTAIINKVWNEFTDHVVLNYKGDSLFYYKAWNSPNATLSTLLKYRDAECYSFAQLFLAALKIQGIVRTNNYVNITAGNNSVCGYQVNQIMVKSWVFGTASAAGQCASFPYKTTYSSLHNATFTGYNFITSDVTDSAGVRGVCTVNPPSVFNNHQIAKVDGIYYDPSYGAKYTALTNIKAAAFSGWGIYYFGSGTNNFLFTNDVSKSNLQESISTY